MFEKIAKYFSKQKPEEYVSCRFMQNGLMFLKDSIHSCCSNKRGITFLYNYYGGKIDWDTIQQKRKKIIQDCKNNIIHDNCVGCVELQKKYWENNDKIEYLYINHWVQCNCGCIYCIEKDNVKHLQKEAYYKGEYNLYQHIKDLYKKKMISPKLHFEMIGGEVAILDEADKIINICLDHGVSIMNFHSSCIAYSKGIERALKEVDTSLEFSLDCGNRELYKKLKRIDAFDQVIENVKKYVNCSEKAKNLIIAKYIIVDGYNDNIESIEEWISLIHKMGIKNAKLEVNFLKFFKKLNENVEIPEHYYKLNEYYKKRVAELGIRPLYWEFSRRILENDYTSKDFL